MQLSVYALAVSGMDVYAGGDFTTAGGVSASRIAKWDGTSWSALGHGDKQHCALLWQYRERMFTPEDSFTTAGGVSCE